MTMRRSAVLIAALAWCAISLGAQSPVVPGGPQQQQPPTFRTGIDLVQLDVSVLDKNRRPVKGLSAADFTVLDNGKPQPIAAFAPVAMIGRGPMLLAVSAATPYKSPADLIAAARAKPGEHGCYSPTQIQFTLPVR
jgi:hypothetical protein